MNVKKWEKKSPLQFLKYDRENKLFIQVHIHLKE